MNCDDTVKAEGSLTRIKKIGKFLNIALIISLVLFSICWSILLFLLIIPLLFPDLLPGAMSADVFLVFRLVLVGVLTAILLTISIQIFKEIAKGETPFSMKQAKRMRWVAIVLLLYVVLEALFSPGIAYLLHIDIVDVSYMVDSGSGNAIMPVNLGALFASAAFFCLSLVFEYGILLQQLSDETL